MDIIMQRISECIGPEHGATKELAEYLDIHPNVITNWKNGSLRSYTKYLDEIAAYYHVSKEWLEGKTDKNKKTPALTNKDKRDIAKDLEELKSSLENNESLMFDGDPMTPEARESILAAMKLGLEAAKVKNKEKYTPKKYKRG